MSTVALVVSGHGYGHSVRCAEVAKALLRKGVHVVVRTDAPRWLYPPDVEWIPSPGRPLDIGVIQHGGLDFDIAATRQRWCELLTGWDGHVDAEARLLCEHRVDLVVADIPPLAFAAAAQAGVPSYGLTNFTWDWIYSAWPDFEDILASIRGAYALADGLFRLPLHGDCSAFVCIEDVPLIARKARRPREAVRRDLRILDDACVVLLSFGGFTANGFDLEALGQLQEYVFVVAPPLRVDTPPPNVVALDEPPADYVSLLAACDVVVTKPGYGIVADCLANRVRMLFTDRGPFREYDVLVQGLRSGARAQYVPREDLLRGEVRPYLAALMQCDTPWSDEPMNGAEVVADRLRDRVTI